jgi:GNAT superfamily N-acetyltransferase
MLNRMIKEVIIEPATAADIPLLAELVNEAYRGKNGQMGWTSELAYMDGPRTDEAMLHELLRRPRSVLLKAHTGEAPAGCVFLEVEGGELHLSLLTVQPGLQTAGIGKQLLQAAETWAQQQRCTTIWITVVHIRAELIAWYERRGFVHTGRSFPFPEQFGTPKVPVHFIEMKKELH